MTKTIHFVSQEENTEADVTFTKDQVIIAVNMIGETDYSQIIHLFEDLQTNLTQTN